MENSDKTMKTIQDMNAIVELDALDIDAGSHHDSGTAQNPAVQDVSPALGPDIPAMQRSEATAQAHENVANNIMSANVSVDGGFLNLQIDMSSHNMPENRHVHAVTVTMCGPNCDHLTATGQHVAPVVMQEHLQPSAAVPETPSRKRPADADTPERPSRRTKLSKAEFKETTTRKKPVGPPTAAELLLPERRCHSCLVDRPRELFPLPNWQCIICYTRTERGKACKAGFTEYNFDAFKAAAIEKAEEAAAKRPKGKKMLWNFTPEADVAVAERWAEQVAEREKERRAELEAAGIAGFGDIIGEDGYVPGLSDGMVAAEEIVGSEMEQQGQGF